MKKILSVLVLFFSFFILAHAAHAQTSQTTTAVPTTTQSVKTVYPLNTDPNVPQDFHTYSQNVFIEILTGISCLLTGYDPLTPNGQCLGIDMTTHKIGYVEGGGGAIGVVGNMIAGTFDVPVSSTAYFKDLAGNFGITKTQYAASTDPDANTPDNASVGYGYSGLKPVLGIWKLFRNMVYLILVLIFIIIGLGIMLRINIDARSVISIQNQLPKIIVGILLVTFSYAIAGFIVDLMYVSMYLIFYLFYSYTLSDPAMNLGGLNPASLQGGNPLSAVGGIGGIGGIASGVAGPIGNIIASMLDNTFGSVVAAIIGGIIGGVAGSIVPVVGTIVGVVGGAATGAIVGSKLLGIAGGLLAYIIVFIALFWALLRLWFLLLRSFVFFLIDVVLSPFWIVLGLLPKGGTAGFGSWLRDTVANLAVFPTTLFILLLAKVFTTKFATPTDSSAFVPPLIGNLNDVSSFSSIVGLGIMLLLPGVVTMVRDTLKAPGFKYTQMIGQSLGAGTNMARQGQALVKKSLWKENRVTGKPEGVKKWVQGNLGKNTFGLLGRGIPGRVGASIGSRFSNQKLQKRAQTFQTQNQAKQIVNNVQRIAVGTGLSKNDPNRANTIYGLEARPVGDGKVEFTLPDGKTVTKGGLVDNLWDPKPTEEGGTPPLTPERRDEVARESTLPPELQNFIEEDKGDLTEDEISEIGKIIRDELNKGENKIRDIKHITTEEEARIRSLRDAAKEQVIKARILPHRPTTNDGTIATDGSHKDDASPSD